MLEEYQKIILQAGVIFEQLLLISDKLSLKDLS